MKRKRTANRKDRVSKVKEIENLLFKLSGYIGSDDFLNSSRERDRDFTRNRKLPFTKLIKFILNFRTKSTQAELNTFYNNNYTPKKSTFFRARLKLKVSTFLDILETMVNLFYKAKGLVKKWKGFRLVAGDLSSFIIPLTGNEKADKELISHFGLAKSKRRNTEVIQGSGHILYDPLNKMIMAATLTSATVKEREILSNQIEKVGKGDLLLLDRGYPAAWLFALIKGRGAHFVARMKRKFSEKIDNFLDSEEKDRIIILKIHPKKGLNRPIDNKTKNGGVRIRLVRVELEDGEIEILATSLFNREKYPTEIFKELYFKRWPIESVFDTLKNKLQIELFSGKRVKVILQDFYAKIIQSNLYRLLEICGKKALKKKTKACQYEYAINENIGFNILKNRWTNLLCEVKKKIIKTIREIVKLLVTYMEPIRPGRKYNRNKKALSKTTIISFAKRAAI